MDKFIIFKNIVQGSEQRVFRSHIESILHILKSQCGMKQAKVAKDLGVSPQALADMKAGRRRFTPELAEKLLQANAKEPWAGWLAEELANYIPLIEGGEIYRAMDPILPQREQQMPVAGKKLPLLRTPFQGEPTSSPTADGSVELPKWAAKLIGDSEGAYALELLTDDYAGRLRAGDQLLVVQEALPDKEIMVVKLPKGLRIARNSMYDPAGKDARQQWMALDSGEALADADPVATVVAILMARL